MALLNLCFQLIQKLPLFLNLLNDKMDIPDFLQALISEIPHNPGR